jgi:hypothetical protein
VANSRTDGNDENSKGLRVPMAIMMITKLIKILKVNRISSRSAGNGTTNMAIINITKNGIPSPVNSKFDKRCRIVDIEMVVIYKNFIKIKELIFFSAA